MDCIRRWVAESGELVSSARQRIRRNGNCHRSLPSAIHIQIYWRMVCGGRMRPPNLTHLGRIDLAKTKTHYLDLRSASEITRLPFPCRISISIFFRFCFDLRSCHSKTHRLCRRHRRCRPVAFFVYRIWPFIRYIHLIMPFAVILCTNSTRRIGEHEIHWSIEEWSFRIYPWLNSMLGTNTHYSKQRAHNVCTIGARTKTICIPGPFH